MDTFFERIATAGFVLLAMSALGQLVRGLIFVSENARMGGVDVFALAVLAGALGQLLVYASLAYWLPIFIRRHLRGHAQ